MNCKRIVFTRPYTAELCDIEVPAPGANEVLVKLCISSISSGTERANLVGDPNVSTNPKVDVSFPRYSGYSSSGIVEAVGTDVTDFKPGDRVALSWSTHTQYVVRPAYDVHHIPDGCSFEEAALWHIATFPLAAIRKCRLEIGESAMVMGMGVLGLAAIKLLRAAGATPIIAVDPDASKRELALAHGADYAFDPFAADFSDTVRKMTGGGTNVGIEVTGNGPALEGLLNCMAMFGRVALLGCTRDRNFTIDYYRQVHGPGITLIGAHTNARPTKESHAGWWTTPDDMEALARLSSSGRLHLAELLQETYSPVEAPAVYDRLANERSFPIVQFDWRTME
ncbi:MAG: zinc-binding alcohol dehydrogenase [Oscillospiraceae bacterium]|nr:zinc-binding alcohol dehydrogenase [Oscillospiraceae bacterium]